VLRALSLGLTLAILWLLLSGQSQLLFLSLGLLSVVVVVSIARRMDVLDPEGHPVHLARLIFLYWPWLVKEIIKANIDTARLILDPRLPISPTVIAVTATQRSDVGRVTYANSITLTPGTVTLAVEDGAFSVHALTRGMAAGVESGDMDRRVTALEVGRGSWSAKGGIAP
jgi:multicomponent Na+:H+ antiporter subunit E